MSKFKEAVKKATLVLGTVTMLAASTLVYNTGINLEKTNDATKFYLESGNNIDKAAKMYQDKWDNSLVSKANNSINDILGKTFNSKDYEVDFGKEKLSALDSIRLDMQQKNNNSDSIKVAQADISQAQVRKNK
jgi:hypothetical protein